MRIEARFLQVIAFVGAWMCIGWLFHLRAETYLVLGVPLSIFFQLVVRRQPLRALWLRNSDRFRLGPIGVLSAVVFIAIPAMALFVTIPKGEWPESTFFVVSCVGAVGAGFTLQQSRLALSPSALRPFAVAVALGILVMAVGAISESRPPWLPASRLPSLLLGVFTYVPVCFAMEEVVFRGLLDTHVWQPGGSRARSWISALVVTSLWGLWHLPILPQQSISSLLAAAPLMVFVHSLHGVFIAFSWRASGSLLLPVIYHSLIDAYRDALHS